MSVPFAGSPTYRETMAHPNTGERIECICPESNLGFWGNTLRGGLFYSWSHVDEEIENCQCVKELKAKGFERK